MYRFQVCQLIIVRVYAGAEEQSCIASVYDLVRTAKLDKVGLMFLISRRDKTVDLGCVRRGAIVI